MIYGWNGSGKTTLSRLFRDLGSRRIPGLGEAVLQVDSEVVQNEDFSRSQVQVRVFNRDFIEESVFRIDGKDIPPVFVLGAENVEKQKEIELLGRKRDASQSNLDAARSAKESAEREYDQYCRLMAKSIKEKLRFGVRNRYNNYDKANFSADAEKFVNSSGTPPVLSDEVREILDARHCASPKESLSQKQYTLPDLEAVAATVSELMQTTVVTSAIARLKEDSVLADWIHAGLELHRKRDAERCQFCEQQLPDDLLATLEEHFSDEYERFLQRIDQEIAKLEQVSANAASLELSDKTRLYDDLSEEYQIAAGKLQAALILVNEFLDSLVALLRDKKSRVFERVALNLQVPLLESESVDQLNHVISKHNRATEKLEERAKEARMRLASDMIASELEEFSRLHNLKISAEKNLQERLDEVQRLHDEISELEREVIEHRKPAEELNKDLREYLGHSELSLEIKETGYELMRNGQKAELPSEGETTAIALLYFLKSLQDKDFDVAKGIVVLDDPVSSLDSNSLFLAFGFIRERTKDAGQVFVLTHNFSLFRQVRNWFHYLERQKSMNAHQRSTRFYMINSVLHDGLRSSTLGSLDPLLRHFESEYQYLFSQVYRASIISGTQSLERNYFLPNIARRLLESFLAFRQPDISGDLWKKMDSVTFDESKKLRILRFLNTYSHSDAVGESEHDLTVLSESPAVLKDLLEMIKKLDEDHYCAMLQLLSRQDAGADSDKDVASA